jgi:hypothetical protein
MAWLIVALLGSRVFVIWWMCVNSQIWATKATAGLSKIVLLVAHFVEFVWTGL